MENPHVLALPEQGVQRPELLVCARGSPSLNAVDAPMRASGETRRASHHVGLSPIWTHVSHVSAQASKLRWCLFLVAVILYRWVFFFAGLARKEAPIYATHHQVREGTSSARSCTTP